VQLYGAREAVIAGRRRITWVELDQRSGRLAGALAASGVTRGGRVAAMVDNGPEIVLLGWALARLGAVLVPISPRLAAPEVEHIVGDSGATLVVAGPEQVGAFGRLAVRVLVADGVDFDRLLAWEGHQPAESEKPDDPILQIYTSGTTGRPKGVLHSQRATIQNALTAMITQDLRHGDVFLSATPLTHTAAGVRIFSLAIDGIAHALLPRFDPGEWLALVERERVTTTIAVAAMLRAILDSPAFEGTDLSSLRLLVYGAAPTPLPLLREAMARFPSGFLHGYGLTEGHPGLTVMGPDEHRRFAADPGLQHRLESIGRAVPSVRVRVVGPDEAELGPGEVGELQVRSTKTMLGYSGNPAATAQVLRNGWLATGDLARIDSEGYVYLAGRLKELLISGGFNVYPSEIERVLEEDPTVLEAAVVGRADERWGEVPVAFVLTRPGRPLDVDRLRARCQANLASYKVPVAIYGVAAFPRTDSGKIAKRELPKAAPGESK
jgi:fatty-acyl-CoA synthase